MHHHDDIPGPVPLRRIRARTATATATAATAAALGLVLAPGAVAAAAEPPPFGPKPYLLRDIAVGPEDGQRDVQAVLLKGKMLFQAQDHRGAELWVSDGTGGHTRLVKDLCPGECDGRPQLLTVLGDQAFFAADTPADGNELWRTDGTAAGTVMVDDVTASGPTDPSSLTVAGGRLWFAASQDQPPYTGQELWVSDGTSAGTRLVKDISPGSDSSAPHDITPLPGGKVLFTAEGTANNRELWASDGTTHGTHLVKDLNGTSAASIGYAKLRLMGGKVVFAANDGVHGVEPWVSDGTSAGTGMLADLVPGSGSSSEGWSAAPLGQQVYFAATTVSHGAEVWRTDGTGPGTQRVTDLNPGGGHSFPFHLNTAGGRLLFVATPGGGRTDLFAYDPADPAPTTGARSLMTLATDGKGAYVTDSLSVNGWYIFVADLPGGIGREVYGSNGTVAGTRVVRDVQPGPGGNIFPPTAVGNSVFWAGTNVELGFEPYVWNTQPTRTLVKPARSYTARQGLERRIKVPVAVSGGGNTISGKVVLRKGSTVLGRGTLQQGKAVVRITKKLSTGRHQVRATFTGSWTGRQSTSREVVLKIG